jgi:serine phosphatase RsbU (regulator of sigma subunit)/pSer/pThr/pTyr-binding forkhead associated (FHA) protein
MNYGTMTLDVPRPAEPAKELTLLPLSGPPVETIVVRPDQPGLIGRQSQCDIQLADPSVSRVHAGLEWKRGRWFITDRMSRAGTMLNALRLEANTPTQLHDGDVLGLGPWRFTVKFGKLDRMTTGTMRQNRLADSSGRVEAVAADELLSRTQRQLGLVMEFATAIKDARTEQALAEVVVRAASQGTGYARSALVKPLMGADRVEVVAAIEGGNLSPRGFPISSSLIRTAASGQVARLTTDPILREAQSIISFGIRSAICAPVTVGDVIAAFLYVDNADQEASTSDDAAAFLAAIAKLGALALADFSRRALEDRQRQLEGDLMAARQAQERLMPPVAGTIGPVTYATRSRPGRLVAGDLFEVVGLDDGRVAVFLGDVAGKGVGAAVLMAAAQTQLRVALKHLMPLRTAIEELNRELTHRSPVGEFISLFVGIIDPKARTMEYVDAGHGYWLHRPGGGPPQQVPHDGGLVLGVEADHAYPTELVALNPGDRIVLFSDGLVEQHSPTGAAFGFEGVFEHLRETQDVEDDVRVLLERLQSFADSDELSDDVTIASLRFDA